MLHVNETYIGHIACYQTQQNQTQQRTVDSEYNNWKVPLTVWHTAVTFESYPV